MDHAYRSAPTSGAITPGWTDDDNRPVIPRIPRPRPSEPLLPECALCGNRRGPWTPTGDRYPSGAQVLICAPTAQCGGQR